ncbi:uncharacterized protein LOC105204452 [Solenopsis invicta]|uniref:uncharacterized protein LOC105204452 n=1 Tax=Solenopsis invicta TaxID=13686 RepID=UPI000595DF6F|nr:uncharacterized protein LOC105204452 [Solenopsis invicta]
MLLKLLIALICLGFAVHANRDETAPRVKTPLGGLKGYYKISQNGRKYEAYEGIPYALPPIGKLRFKPPRPIPAWIGELLATKFGSECIQYNQVPVTPERVEGAEDCLYLNIYVPVQEKGTNKTPMPVLFWIHGGAFQFGSGMLYNAKYLMDHNVILVTINYRLGPMGFLSTEDEVVPGNMGLKDQNMALRWVSQNIEWFGGDPKKVTLVGLSAGGASVHYHYLSQLSAGLFRGGISFSGTAFDCWTQAENSLEKAKKLSALMGCPTNTSRDMIRCMRYRPARAIVQATSEFMPFFYNPFSPFGPVPERFGDEAPFIDRTPVEIINSGDVQDVPWVTGVTSEEGLYPVAEFIAGDENLKRLNDNWDLLGLHLLDFNYTIPKEKHVEIARIIKKHYFGSKPIDRQSTKELVQMASDRLFVVDSEKAARMQAKVNQNPVWYYYFSYRGAQSLSDGLSGTTENYGVSHADDILYVLATPWVDPTTTQQDRDMQKQLIDFWVLFATEGIPKVGNVEWPKLDPSKKELHYLHIASPDKINMDSHANLGEKEFWNSINFNENVLRRTGINKEELLEMMLLKLLIVLFGFGFVIHANTDETIPRVKTPLGGLKGYYKFSQNGRKYEAYEGVPYALPPVGKLRFKAPRPIPAWVGELSATKLSSVCIQYDQVPAFPPEKVVGTEDCLYLNIYVPAREKRENKTPMPVIFWIHGGAFQCGSGILYGPKYLMDHDVILVTINYRLGPMGFLSTEDEVVPGNMGLKDQNMALRWVSQNIEWFGGDPKKVTLVGLSAGGASVHYHYLSQMSSGLFRGGISFSGTTFDCWTQAENSLEKAKKLSALMGCPTITTRDMIRCLRYRPAHVIVQATSEFMPFFFNPFTPFGPVTEKFGDETPFIDRTPIEIISSGDVQDLPWITGVTSEEGLYPVAEFIADDKNLKWLNDNWDILGPDYLDFNYTIPREKHIELARLIKNHYFGTKPIDRQSTKELIQMSSDRFFVVDGEKAARMQAKVNRNPVWFHYFSYRGAQSLSDAYSGTIVNYGVSHGDDVVYVLNTSWVDPTTTQKDRDMQKHLIDFWVLFATEGIAKVANVEYPRLDPLKKELHYLHIAAPDDIKLDSNDNLGEKKFWNSINFKENILKHTIGSKKDEL